MEGLRDAEAGSGGVIRANAHCAGIGSGHAARKAVNHCQLNAADAGAAPKAKSELLHGCILDQLRLCGNAEFIVSGQCHICRFAFAADFIFQHRVFELHADGGAQTAAKVNLTFELNRHQLLCASFCVMRSNCRICLSCVRILFSGHLIHIDDFGSLSGHELDKFRVQNTLSICADNGAVILDGSYIDRGRIAALCNPVGNIGAGYSVIPDDKYITVFDCFRIIPNCYRLLHNLNIRPLRDLDHVC